MSEQKHTQGPSLHAKDLKVILYVFQQNLHAVQSIGLPPGTPFLIAGWRAKRARHLVDLGFIKDHKSLSPPMADVLACTVAPEGIDAYNAAIAAATGVPQP
jgi:hypothetical protein